MKSIFFIYFSWKRRLPSCSRITNFTGKRPLTNCCWRNKSVRSRRVWNVTRSNANLFPTWRYLNHSFFLLSYNLISFFVHVEWVEEGSRTFRRVGIPRSTIVWCQQSATGSLQCRGDETERIATYRRVGQSPNRTQLNDTVCLILI